jgi:site-specific DNA-methyltransferase (adenine-specific)
MNNEIHIGNTIEVLKKYPDNYFDCTVTSPPYNKAGAAGGLVKEVEYANSTDSVNEEQYVQNQIDVLNEIFRVTKSFGYIFYNHKLRWINGVMSHPYWWLIKTRWDQRQEIIWDRGIAAQLRGWRFWQLEERVYWMQKGLRKEELKSKHAKLGSVWRLRPEGGFKDHPAPFPIEFPTRCIYSVADEQRGLNILDPYCGTGTTLVAAKIMGHNYVGIDISGKYVEIARKRLEITQVDNERVCAEMNLHNVQKSYKERKRKKVCQTVS